MKLSIHQAGFTLLEVMVALSILAVALVAAVESVSGHVRNEVHLKERTFAHWVAMNKVAELRGSGEWPSAGEFRGTSEMANQEYAWTVTVKQFGDGDVRRLDVKVTPDDEPDNELTSLIAFIGKPAT